MEAFKEEFLEQEGRILVKFGADWCGPCKMLEPVLTEVANDGYTVYSVDADQEPDLTVKYGVRGVPTMFLFENGKILRQVSGAMPKNKVIEFIEE